MQFSLNANLHSKTYGILTVMTRAGEPELEPGALKPSIFSGAGAFLNISCGAGATKYLSAPVLSIANFNNFLS